MQDLTIREPFAPYLIYIWNPDYPLAEALNGQTDTKVRELLQDVHNAMPASLDQARAMYHVLKNQAIHTASTDKLAALVKHLQTDTPCDDETKFREGAEYEYPNWWVQTPEKALAQLDSPVLELEIGMQRDPSRAYMWLTHSAKKHGLVVFDDLLDMVMVPSVDEYDQPKTQVYPLEHADIFTKIFKEGTLQIDDDGMGFGPELTTKAKVRKALMDELLAELKPHGFKRAKAEGWDGRLVRELEEGGTQEIMLAMESAFGYPKKYKGILYFTTNLERTFLIAKAALKTERDKYSRYERGVGGIDDFKSTSFFSKKAKITDRSPFVIVSEHLQRRYVSKTLMKQIFPILDAASSVTGMDEISNVHNPFPIDRRGSYFMNMNLTRIICAWLNNNPQYETILDEVVAKYESVGLETKDKPKEIDHYLKAHVPRNQNQD